MRPNREFVAYNLVDEPTSRGHFALEGRTALGPALVPQTIEDYMTSLHSRNGLSRDRMPPGAAREFDAAIGNRLSSHATDGAVTLRIATAVAWGRCRA